MIKAVLIYLALLPIDYLISIFTNKTFNDAHKETMNAIKNSLK